MAASVRCGVLAYLRVPRIMLGRMLLTRIEALTVIVILALVALFIGLRLYSVLGERTGHEQQPILKPADPEARVEPRVGPVRRPRRRPPTPATWPICRPPGPAFAHCLPPIRPSTSRASSKAPRPLTGSCSRPIGRATRPDSPARRRSRLRDLHWRHRAAGEGRAHPRQPAGQHRPGADCRSRRQSAGSRSSPSGSRPISRPSPATATARSSPARSATRSRPATFGPSAATCLARSQLAPDRDRRGRVRFFAERSRSLH